jgi:hypothetical protein
MKKLSTATALALILVAGTASAQVFDVSDMHMGRTMLEAQISNAFTDYGIEQDLTVLSLAQIATIEGILSDSSLSNSDTKAAIEAAIRNN